MDHMRRNQISRWLREIEQEAGWIKYHTDMLQDCAEMLDWRPVWETMARDKLTKAEAQLMEALARVRAIRSKYDDLPVIVDVTAT